MLEWFKSLFKKKKRIAVLDEHGNLEQDEMLVEAMNKAWFSGKPVIANRNDDGSFEIKEMD